LRGFGSRVTNVKLYHCSIRARMPIGDIGGGIVRRVVKEGIKELTVSEGIRVSRCGCILIETLLGAKGDLEHVSIVQIHFGVWKRANVEKSCLEKEENFSYFLTGKLMGASNKGSL
jgi:hypothetical protein